MVANALNLAGQNERDTDLRGEPLPGTESQREDEADEG
jgi:hypothetical protein